MTAGTDGAAGTTLAGVLETAAAGALETTAAGGLMALSVEAAGAGVAGGGTAAFGAGAGFAAGAGASGGFAGVAVSVFPQPTANARIAATIIKDDEQVFIG